MSCADLTTDLNLEEALHVLEPFFEEIRERFVGAGLERSKGTRFYVAPWVHDAPRHFAACSETGREIVAAPEMAELSADIVVAILAHEFGHASDFLYPGEFVLTNEGMRRRQRSEGDDTQWVRWMHAWENRENDVVERTADAVAEWVIGSPIGYVGPCQLECFCRGEARPQGLR
jgi:hypothetical protein